MEALLQILAILFLAKIFSELSERVGLPGMIGEIGAGMFFAFAMKPDDIEVVTFFAELGAIFLLFTAGYREVHVNDLKAASTKALIPTLTQILFAFGFGFMLGNMFGFGFTESLFLAVAFSPTSISVVVKTLIDTDYLSSKPGSMMLTSAIFDDVIGIFLLSVVVSVATLNQFPSAEHILGILVNIIIFVIIMILLGWKVFPRLFEQVQKMHTRESIFSFVIIIALLSAYLSEFFGLHAVIGAFFGGVLLSDLPLAKIETVQKKVSGIAYGFFTPLFFAFIGLTVETEVLYTAGIFTTLVIVLALSGKLIGGFIGTKLVGFGSKDSLIFGIGMMPRAGVELVVIAIGKELGIISNEVFSAIVLMVVVSIIVSPILLEMSIRYKEKGLTEPEQKVA
ncbi:cation:proton antiporter [Methanolobus profundi]|uniref:Kef-type K+ transport system, membrane component KefB n=1 Tax=Methanolobus profundi TaxID=487685 RepID=A0A1I4R192_9EURY|nr:cation:proton antiporter [Methanolobus profundi]SFM46027.1 Kef-type K+ transport system, membrane component KefB [Methanolobus profundi]